MNNNIGYKAFEKGMVCRGKQYAENTVFEENDAKICSKGMHYCKNPFDVLDYYSLVNMDGSFNEFATVEPMAEELTDDNNKKFCTTKLKIGAKLDFSGFIKACVEFVIEKTTFSTKAKENNKDKAVISSKTNYAQIGSSGNSVKIGSSGADAQIGSSGAFAQIGSSGNSAQISSSGNYAQIGSSGNSAQIGSSGADAQIGSSGAFAQIGSSGADAQISSSGDSVKIGSSGDSAQIGSSGADAVICCAGHNSIVKAQRGSWITLSEWIYSDEKGRYVPKCVKTEYVDGEHIKADTFYKLIDGKFVEVEEK